MRIEQRTTITLTDKEQTILKEAYEVLNNISRMLEVYNWCIGDDYDAENISDVANVIDDLSDYFKGSYIDENSEVY